MAILEGRYQRSRAFLERAVALDPMLGEAWRWLGALHDGSKRAICLQWAQRSIPHATIPPLPQPREVSPPAIPAAQSTPAAHAEAEPAGAATSLRSPWRTWTMATTTLVLASLVALGGFELAYADRIYPGVQAFGVSLSGMAASEAQGVLAPRLTAWAAQSLNIQAGDQQWTLPLGRLVNFDPQHVATSAYQVGRSGSWSSRLHAQGHALLRDLPVPGLALPEATLTQLLDAVAEQVDRPAQSAILHHGDDGAWLIIDDQVGQVLDRAAARQAIVDYWSSIDWAGQPHAGSLRLPVQTLAPAQTSADLQPKLPQIQAQTAAPLLLKTADQEWALERAPLLNVTQPWRPGQPIAADRTAIRAQLSELAAAYDRQPQPSMLVREGNFAREWRLPQTGRALDVDAAADLVVAELEHPSDQPLTLPVVTTQPPPGDLEQLGIIAQIGQGKSQFASYSSPNRDANVQVGGSEFDGLLIAPGEVLSFDATVGEISAAKGYALGEMIAGGVVVPSFGGGICQVSTTLFRAAFWSGLDVVERHFHSWRLAWYEVDAPPGMDATIALGGPDLKLRNNTAGYILIDVDTDLSAKTQTFTLYGTPRDIEVRMLGPDWAGGGIVITRQIFQDQNLIQEDHWASYYTQ